MPNKIELPYWFWSPSDRPILRSQYRDQLSLANLGYGKFSHQQLFGGFPTLNQRQIMTRFSREIYITAPYEISKIWIHQHFIIPIEWATEIICFYKDFLILWILRELEKKFSRICNVMSCDNTLRYDLSDSLMKVSVT